MKVSYPNKENKNNSELSDLLEKKITNPKTNNDAIVDDNSNDQSILIDEHDIYLEKNINNVKDHNIPNKEMDDSYNDLRESLLKGDTPIISHDATGAGVSVSSAIWNSTSIEYDNDQLLAKAGFDTEYQPVKNLDNEYLGGIISPDSTIIIPNPEPEITPDPKPLPVAKISIDSISQDNVVTAAESNSPQTITGTVGGDVKAGDVVTVYLDGKEIGQAIVVSNNGKLEWSLDVDGSTLLGADVDTISATVTTTDQYGQVATDSATHDYTVDIQASITIDKITGDNVITQQEGHEAFLPITGTVGEDVREGDTVTVTINGHEYQTTVKPDLTWEVEVTGNDILHADKATASVTTSYDTDKNVTVSADQYYEVVIDATVTIENIGDDFVINKDESEGKVPVTGTTGGDVKEGDTVTVTVNGKDYTATVDNNGSWTVDVDGSDLIANGNKPIQATVTTCDGAGHCANGEDDKGYDIDIDINASIEITVIADDDYINEDEAKGTVSISGVVGGDVKEGDVVTLTVDGKEIGTAIVEKNEAGDLVWTATSIDGAILANANLDQVTATVTATDDADNSVTVTNTHDYLEATLDAKVTITSVAGDNALNEAEVKPGVLVAITGTVGGDVKAGDTVVVTVDGVKHKVTVNDDLTWTLEVDGSVLAGSKKPIVTADVIIKDNYGNTASANATDSYIIPKLDVVITIDSINDGNPITGVEHDANTPIEVTGKVGGDAKVGDTVTLKIGDNTVETKVIVLEDGKLGYVTEVPAGMFTPDSNDLFDGDISAQITIKDDYGNVASDDANKEFEAIGSIIVGTDSNDHFTGTSYNDLLIGDDIYQKPDVDVNIVLDVSGSMSRFVITPDSLHIDDNYTSGKIGYFDDNHEFQFVQDFNSKQELIDYFEGTMDVNILQIVLQNAVIQLPDGSFQKFTIDDFELHTRIEQAKDSVLEIAEHYSTTLDQEQLAALDFTLITFASTVEKNVRFHWDFERKLFVNDNNESLESVLSDVVAFGATNDFNTAISAGINGFTDPDSENILFFVSDGLDGDTSIDDIKNNTNGNLDKFKPTIIPTLIGSDVSNTIPKDLSDIASLGNDYNTDNTGDSKVIIVKDITDLAPELNDAFDNILGGNDVIHGGDGNDIIIANTLNNEWLLEQYGSEHTHMSDLLNSGVTLSEVLFTVAAKEQGVNVDELTTKDVYQFVLDNSENLIVAGNEESKGNNSLFGDAGNDILFGSNASDTLTGGTGDDLIYGMNGNDILISDAGNDILTGGQGDDLFKLDVLATNENTHTAIMDFEKGDLIDLSSILDDDKDFLDDILAHVSSAVVTGTDVSITFDGKHEVEIKDAIDVYGDLGNSTSDIVNNLFVNNVFHNDFG